MASRDPSDHLSAVATASCDVKFHFPGGSLDELRAAKEAAGPPRHILLSSSTTSTCGTQLLATQDAISASESFCNCEPPDAGLAVGPNHVVVAVNSAMKVLAKNGTLLQGPINLATMMAPAGDPLPLFSDPIVLYDASADRYALLVMNYNSSETTSTLNVAVTKTSDPTGAWWLYTFAMPAGELFDFPHAAIDGSVLYATGNLFGGSPQAFLNARALALNLAQMYAGTAPTPVVRDVGNNASGVPADTLMPALHDGATNVMYFLSADNATNGGSQISLFRWADPLGANAFALQGGVGVVAFQQPPLFYQAGLQVETNDTRDLASWWDSGTLYGAHTVGMTAADGTTVAAVQWYQLGNLDGAPTLLQQGNDEAAVTERFFPALATDGAGNLMLGYACQTATGIGICYAARFASTASGVLEPETLVVPGSGLGSTSRWGDYGAMAYDASLGRFWHLMEYQGTDSSWNTLLSQISFDSTPGFDVYLSPAYAEIISGNAATFSVATDVCNGYTGTIDLSASNLPNNTTPTFSPPSLSGAGTSTLTLQTAPTTTFDVRDFVVTGTDSHGSPTASNVARFRTDQPCATAFGSNLYVRMGTTDTNAQSVTVSPEYGYTGTVLLTSSGLPTGASYTFVPSSVSGGSGTSTFTITTNNAPASSYTVYLITTDSQGTCTSRSSINVTILAPDFTVSASPSAVTVRRGSAVSTTVTATSQNGFSGNVTWSASGLPAGASATFTPQAASVPANGSGSSTLRITTTSATPVGTFTVTVQGVNGGLSHTTTVSLTVKAH